MSVNSILFIKFESDRRPDRSGSWAIGPPIRHGYSWHDAHTFRKAHTFKDRSKTSHIHLIPKHIINLSLHFRIILTCRQVNSMSTIRIKEYLFRSKATRLCKQLNYQMSTCLVSSNWINCNFILWIHTKVVIHTSMARAYHNLVLNFIN